MTAPQKYRKKPIVIEAMQMPHGYPDGVDASSDGYARNLAAAAILDWLTASGVEGVNHLSIRENAWAIDPEDGALLIGTLEGTMRVSLGDYIIRGAQGEFYPCKPDIFEATYEKAGN